MIDPSRVTGSQADADPGKRLPASAANADAHALKTLLAEKSTAPGLSDLFSSQTRQVLAPCHRDMGLTERLTRYQAQKEAGQTPPPAGDADTSDSQQDRPDPRQADWAEALARDVADQILVPDPEHTDPGAGDVIHIRIKDSILKDATVQLIRQPDCLQVRLISGDADSIRTLIAARDSLDKQLGKHYDGLIRIHIVPLTEIPS